MNTNSWCRLAPSNLSLSVGLPLPLSKIPRSFRSCGSGPCQIHCPQQQYPKFLYFLDIHTCIMTVPIYCRVVMDHGHGPRLASGCFNLLYKKVPKYTHFSIIPLPSTLSLFDWLLLNALVWCTRDAWLFPPVINKEVGFQAYAGGRNVAHRTILAAPHSTAQTTYALPHRGRSMSRVATDQYVLGSAESNRSAICVCAFVSKVTPSIVACAACAVVVTGLRPPDLPLISEDM